jgi:hypothetical protein
MTKHKGKDGSSLEAEWSVCGQVETVCCNYAVVTYLVIGVRIHVCPFRVIIG